MAYKLFVGVNYATDDKNIECNPEDLVKTIQTIQDIMLAEENATGFVFTIQVEKGEDVSTRSGKAA